MARTARDLSIKELRSYRPWLNLERYENDPEVAKRRERAWEVARAVARQLKTRYGAIRVMAFGSLAHKSRFTPWSDVDLAAWGIQPQDYYSALGTAMDLGLECGIRVDVVDPATCSEVFLKGIEQEGIEL